MKRAGAALALLVLTVALLWAMPRGGALEGVWQATVTVDATEETGQPISVVVRYTFDAGGGFTCALAADEAGLDGAETLSGNYVVRGGRLYLSDGADYRVDPAAYERFRLEGDTLTLEGHSGGDTAGFYPLTLKRVA